MVEQRTEAASPEATATGCAHHWQIETPAGETSEAMCKYCGATRSFANYNQRRATARTIKPTANGAAS